jgi:O-antigen biosynthesis protein
MPEWYLLVAALAVLALLGLSWPPLLWSIPLLGLAVAAPVAQAVVSAWHAQFPKVPASLGERITRRVITAGMHLAQPMARLLGRLRHGLTPWRRSTTRVLPPLTALREKWRESWQAHEDWVEALERELKKDGIPVCRGSEYDRWDLRARTGTTGTAVALLAIEEHGSGKQLARWRLAPRPSVSWVVAMLVLGLLALGAGLDGAWVASVVLAVATAVLGWRIASDCGAALGALSDSVDRTGA